MAKIKSNGVELNYIREGAGETVLLVHGYLFGAEFWRPQIDALKDRYDVVAVDLRGQMDSEATEDQAGYDVWNQAEDIHGLIAQLDLAPVHYVGLSMGGFIGMRLALAHAGDIRSMVLMDTSPFAEDPDKAAQYEAFRLVIESGELDAVVASLPTIFLADDFVEEHPDQVDAWLARLTASNLDGVVRAGRGIDARDDITGRLGEIAVPTLVIHGTEDVPFSMDHAEKIVSGIPGARLETVSGGHQSNVDRPQETSRLIRDFLAMVGERAATTAGG